MFDAIGFCRDYSIPFWEKGKNVSSDYIGVRCPFCSDHSNHGGINLMYGTYTCWKCGASDFAKYIQNILNIPLNEAIKIKIKYSSGNIYSTKKIISKIKKIELPGDALQKEHKRYLRNRKFDPILLIKKYKIRGTDICGEWKFRIMIPIFFDNRLVSYTGRDITNKQQLRYKTLSVEKSVMNPKYILYGLEYCQSKKLIGVVEGPFDVWRMGDNFCATLGTNVTEQQIALLMEYKKVIFFFDVEKEAYEKAKKAGEKLAACGISVEIVVLEKGDPADFTQVEVLRIRKEFGFEN